MKGSSIETRWLGVVRVLVCSFKLIEAWPACALDELDLDDVSCVYYLRKHEN